MMSVQKLYIYKRCLSVENNGTVEISICCSEQSVLIIYIELKYPGKRKIFNSTGRHYSEITL
jgi:hypothetical protein